MYRYFNLLLLWLGTSKGGSGPDLSGPLRGPAYTVCIIKMVKHKQNYKTKKWNVTIWPERDKAECFCLQQSSATRRHYVMAWWRHINVDTRSGVTLFAITCYVCGNDMNSEQQRMLQFQAAVTWTADAWNSIPSVLVPLCGSAARWLVQ
jgi:hypothetical protein